MEESEGQVSVPRASDIESRLAAVEDALARPAPEAKPDAQRDILQFWYGQAVAYDLHYSTVRSAISTLVIALTIGMGQLLLDRGKAYCIIVTIVLLLSVIALNVYFQGMTWSCRYIQREIERRLAAGTAAHDEKPIELRAWISEVYRTKADPVRAFFSDRPLQFLLFGSLIYVLVLIVLAPGKPPVG